MKKSINILSYNIHKGFNLGNREFILDQIKNSIKNVSSDLVFLQEVMGSTEKQPIKFSNWISAPQFEFLADSIWKHHAYGKNAINSYGNHGNAILSKFPIESFSNTDISSSRFERRGILYGKIDMEGVKINVFCIHFSLLSRDRIKQFIKLKKLIKLFCQEKEPIIIAGDFNDWNTALHGEMKKEGFDEAFEELFGELAISFPSKIPFLKLDRIYYKNLKASSALCLSGVPWSNLSDHLALSVNLELI